MNSTPMARLQLKQLESIEIVPSMICTYDSTFKLSSPGPAPSILPIITPFLHLFRRVLQKFSHTRNDDNEENKSKMNA